MPEKNVLFEKAWQKEGGFRLEEKSRDRFSETHLSSNSDHSITHEIRVSDFATLILKNWFKKLHDEQHVRRLPLTRAFIPVSPISWGETFFLHLPSSSFALLMQWEECSILRAWKAERRDWGAPIHPGTFWRMHAHFWAMDCLPQQSAWTWNLQ